MYSKFKFLTGTVLGMALCAASFAQTVTSSLVGTVVDQQDAVVVGAPVTLTSAGTGQVRQAVTDSLGSYRFVNLEPGIYNLTVKAPGFKSETQTGIEVVAQETHNAGRTRLQVGNATDTITVTANSAQVQLASSEKAATVDNHDLSDLTLKGRDLFGYPRLVPGVIDTSGSRDVTSHGAISGMNINGSTSALNFTVDGITDMDTGSNTSVQFEPNLDSIEELKVLTSNYAAEYGRNSGGMITAVTKSGTQEFHGSAAWNHRHEEFDADTWVNNHTIKNGAATPRVPYRYNVEPYSIGGPAYIPKVFNRQKNRLFFFWSQEYTGQFVSGGSQSVYTPTALERMGDFSKSFNNNGSLINVLDPANNNQPFPGNIIPSSRINPLGQALLNFFPLPNYTPTLAAQTNVVNYFEQASATHPRRNSVLRVDGTVTSKISAYFRWNSDYDTSNVLYDGVPFTSDQGGTLGATGISPIEHPNGGRGYLGSVTYTISPTMINEFTVANNWDQYTYVTTDNYKTESSSLIPGLPSLFPVPGPSQSGSQGPINGYASILPTFSFGGTPSNAVSYGRTGASAGQEIAINPTFYYTDNLTKIAGHHSFKTGLYVEYNEKYQPADRNYAGAFSFASSSSTPLLNTNDGFANALLGNVNSYSQYSATTTFNVNYWNVEFYAQDNWKVNGRLTLDLGVRFYHQTPQQDYFHTFVNFNPSTYSASAIPRIYVPYCSTGAATCTSSNGLVAKDPGSGATVSSGFIGDYVPNTGNPTDGLQVLGVNGVPLAPYHQAPIAAAPRIGFAYDLTGDGKTALRGGWGMFFNRLDGNQYYGLSGQPPTAYPVTVNTLTLSQIAAQNTGAPPSLSSLSIAPLAPTAWPAQVPWDAVMNSSINLQRQVGRALVVEVGYTLSYSYNQHLTYNINYIPLGTGWPFNPANLNPTTAGNTSADIGSIFERTKYPGYGAITENAMIGHDNYNAFTSSLQQRLWHGLVVGAAYTYSKALGTTAYTPAVANNEAWNYGRLSIDRRNNLQISYYYDFPNVAKRYGVKGLGLVIDHWTFSGITSVQSGAPFNPGCGLTSGAAGVTGGYTGTPDVSQRCQVIGNPLANIPAGTYFNPAAFAMPALATGPDNSIVGPPALGNLGGGAGVLTYPRITNFDLTITKNFPLGVDTRRVLRFQVQAYNAFNHPEFNAMNTGIQFNPTTNAVSNGTSVGLPTGTLPARVMAFTARLQF
jgi:outer membrane receptor protein involved in Fe transport